MSNCQNQRVDEISDYAALQAIGGKNLGNGRENKTFEGFYGYRQSVQINNATDHGSLYLLFYHGGTRGGCIAADGNQLAAHEKEGARVPS